MTSKTHLTFEELEFHTIELKNHLLKWLFENETGNLPSKDYLDQIFPLNHMASKFLWDYETLIRIYKFYPDINKYYKKIITYEDLGREEKKLKKWLFNLGIPFRTKVYLSIHPEAGIILTWKMVLKFCSKIFFAHDLVLYDKTLNWGLYYHHDEKYHFGKNRIYNSSLESQKLLDDAKLINDWKKRIYKNTVTKK